MVSKQTRRKMKAPARSERGGTADPDRGGRPDAKGVEAGEGRQAP